MNRCSTDITNNTIICTDEIKQIIASSDYCGDIKNITGELRSCVSNLGVDHDIAYTQCEFDLCEAYDDFDLMKELANSHVIDYVGICMDMGNDEPIREYENNKNIMMSHVWAHIPNRCKTQPQKLCFSQRNTVQTGLFNLTLNI